MIKLFVTAAEVAVEENEIITEGRAGLCCQVSFSRDWEGLVKTAAFEGAESRDVILTGERVTIPAECLSAAGRSLKVGFYGKSTDGAVVIPTAWATLGMIENSVYPSGKAPAPPTPDVVAQIQQAAANAEKLARSVREDADLGKFKGPAGAKGDKGDKGDTGPAGKSAYGYAVDGGYTGTEAEFAAKLAAEKFTNPNALTFTGAATGSYDGSEAVTVEIPSGGDGLSAFEKIGTIDLSTMAASNSGVEYTVTDVTEVVLVWTGMTNTTTANSSLVVGFNGGDTYNTLGPRTGKAGSPQNGYTYLKVLEGVGLLAIAGNGALANTNFTSGGAGLPYNLIPVKEKIQTLKIGQPPTQYYADAGIVEVYVR